MYMKKSSNVKNVQDSLFAYTESAVRSPQNVNRKLALRIFMELIENSKNFVGIYRNGFFNALFYGNEKDGMIFVKSYRMVKCHSF